MSVVKIDSFGGMAPTLSDRQLPDRNAANSQNAWLYSGELVGMHAPTLLRSLTDPAATKVYRIPNSYTDPKYLTNSVWLEFQNPDTDILRANVVGDTFDRYYYASPVTVPQYNTKARILLGSAPFTLGIPTPGATSVAVAGGVSVLTTTRSYLCTWVSAYGEEGAAGVPVVVTGKPDDTWTVTIPATGGSDTTNRNLSKVRIYRTVTSSTGVATYFLVVELAIATATYADTLSDTVVASHSGLASTNWVGPPSDLKGFIAMPNGIFAGFRANEVWFCEPFRPHAWPAAYAITVDFPIVGLGVVNQALIVCTTGYPTAISGVHPASMAEAKLSAIEPCMSRGSILSAPEGVYYASPNGLVLVSGGTATNITRDLVTKDRWSTLVNIATLRAARLGTSYYGWGTTRLGVFETTAFETTAFAQQDFTGAFAGVVIDPPTARVGFNLMSNAVPIANLFNDPWSGEVFIIRAGKLYWIDLTETSVVHEAYTWKSKIFQTTDKKDLAALRIYFTVPAGTAAQNPVRNTTTPQTLAADQYGLVRVYADDNLVLTREIRTSGELMRIPSGGKFDFWQIELVARVNISSVQFGTSVRELKKV